MRHRKLVFAILLGLSAAFSTYSQDVIDFTSRGISADQSVKGGRKADPITPQVYGQITDFAGRSIKSAKISFFGLFTDEVVTVRSNIFGYYQTADLTPGSTYVISVEHGRYLFIMAPPNVTVGDEPIEFDFEGELAH